MPKRKNKFIWVMAAAIALLIFFQSIGALAPLEAFFGFLSKPLAGGLYSLGSSAKIFYNRQLEKRDLSALVNEQKNQINQLVSENAKLQILEEENEKLRNYLKFFQKTEKKYIMGNIISSVGKIGIMARNQSIIIDKGSSDGLVPGLAAISSQGMIIGKIIEVKDNISIIHLVTNPLCKLAATVLNSEKTMGIAEGEFGLTVKMNFIPQNNLINEGQTVITSGLEQNIPRGLVIGKITQISKASNELWQDATIEPLINLDSLIVISVILP